MRPSLRTRRRTPKTAKLTLRVILSGASEASAVEGLSGASAVEGGVYSNKPAGGSITIRRAMTSTART